MAEYIERGFSLDVVKRTSGDYAAAFAEIAHAPAADVAEVRHGRWIDNTFCSCCGGFDEDDEGNIIQSFHNYCPACGALMDKEDEHEAD